MTGGTRPDRKIGTLMATRLHPSTSAHHNEYPDGPSRLNHTQSSSSGPRLNHAYTTSPRDVWYLSDLGKDHAIVMHSGPLPFPPRLSTHVAMPCHVHVLFKLSLTSPYPPVICILWRTGLVVSRLRMAFLGKNGAAFPTTSRDHSLIHLGI